MLTVSAWHLDIAICLVVIAMKKCFTIAFGERFRHTDTYRYNDNKHYRHLALAITILLEAIIYRTTFVFVRIIFTYVLIVSSIHLIQALRANHPWAIEGHTATKCALPAPQPLQANTMIAAPRPFHLQHTNLLKRLCYGNK